MVRPALTLVISLVAVAPLAAQHGSTTHDPHAAVLHARGAKVMGFDQTKATHLFLLYEDGGAIEVSVTDPKDTTTRDAIRAHLPHIAALFGQGNFDSPERVHDTTAVPGTASLAQHKAKITYTYVETPAGGRVDIVTSDRAALTAVHEFLKFQIADHKTGDSTVVRKREVRVDKNR